MRRRPVSVVLCALLVSGVLGSTASSAPEPGVVQFSAVGDISSSSNASGVLNAIGALDNDVTFAVGDLSYGQTGQEQAWCDFVTSRVGAGYPFELLAGNHESNGQNGNINDFSACLPNQLPGLIGTYGRQYYVDVPQEAPLVRYVMISPGIPFPDGTWSYDAGTPRYQWTEQAIDGARAANIPWIVVGMHMPCLSIGQYPCIAGADITNLLISKRVDLVLNGHEHLYQRSKQLRLGAGCAAVVPGTFNASCVVDGDATLDKGAGTVMATIGTGGVELRNVNPADSEADYFAASSGLNQSPTFGALDMSATADQLTAAFLRSGSGTFPDTFTITRQAGVPNEPPVASFTSSCDDLDCDFDASGSSDPDGTIVSRAWTFGDGSTGSGATPSHTYAAAGTYTVGLTVTDDDGSTASTTRSVMVTGAPQPTVYASDDFARTVSNGLGTAPVGGPWSVTGSAANYAVTGGVGTIRVNAGSGPTASLAGVAAPAVDLRLQVSTDKPASGSGLYVSVIGRRVAGAGYYRAKLRLQSNGSVALSLQRLTPAGAEVALQGEIAVPGLTYAVGDVLNVRLEVSGNSPTTVRAKVWKQGTTEPAAWQRTASDATAGLQAAGAIGVAPYLSSSANNAPITVRLDNLTAIAP